MRYKKPVGIYWMQAAAVKMGKALGVREALVRIEDAAGTELDERLVRAFVMGIESAPNPPLPEAEGGRSLLWTAVRRVA